MQMCQESVLFCRRWACWHAALCAHAQPWPRAGCWWARCARWACRPIWQGAPPCLPRSPWPPSGTLPLPRCSPCSHRYAPLLHASTEVFLLRSATQRSSVQALSATGRCTAVHARDEGAHLGIRKGCSQACCLGCTGCMVAALRVVLRVYERKRFCAGGGGCRSAAARCKPPRGTPGRGRSCCSHGGLRRVPGSRHCGAEMGAGRARAGGHPQVQSSALLSRKIPPEAVRSAQGGLQRLDEQRRRRQGAAVPRALTGMSA